MAGSLMPAEIALLRQRVPKEGFLYVLQKSSINEKRPLRAAVARLRLMAGRNGFDSKGPRGWRFRQGELD